MVTEKKSQVENILLQFFFNFQKFQIIGQGGRVSGILQLAEHFVSRQNLPGKWLTKPILLPVQRIV